jgi:hypothetical protein
MTARLSVIVVRNIKRYALKINNADHRQSLLSKVRGYSF